MFTNSIVNNSYINNDDFVWGGGGGGGGFPVINVNQKVEPYIKLGSMMQSNNFK